jgi:hypothetical protein
MDILEEWRRVMKRKKWGLRHSVSKIEGNLPNLEAMYMVVGLMGQAEKSFQGLKHSQIELQELMRDVGQEMELLTLHLNAVAHKMRRLSEQANNVENYRDKCKSTIQDHLAEIRDIITEEEMEDLYDLGALEELEEALEEGNDKALSDIISQIAPLVIVQLPKVTPIILNTKLPSQFEMVQASCISPLAMAEERLDGEGE